MDVKALLLLGVQLYFLDILYDVSRNFAHPISHQEFLMEVKAFLLSGIQLYLPNTLEDVSHNFSHLYAILANKVIFLQMHKSFLCLCALHLDYHNIHLKLGTACLCLLVHKSYLCREGTHLGWKISSILEAHHLIDENLVWRNLKHDPCWIEKDPSFLHDSTL